MQRKSFAQRVTSGSIRYLQPVQREDADGLTALVYAQAEKDFELVPPITIHSVVPEILAGVWILTREAYLVGRTGRADREAIAAAVSLTNKCPFCVEVHSSMLHGAGQHRLAEDIMVRQGTGQQDPLVGWALASRTPGSAVLQTPPFSRESAPQMLGTAVLYHFINRMVSVFLEPSPVPVSIKSPRLKHLVGRAMGAVAGRLILGKDVHPGRSLQLLPDAPLPKPFSWAEPNANVAAALARFSAAIEHHGKLAVPTSVRLAVQRTLEQWNGEEMPLSSSWLAAELRDLPTPTERAIARLALLTALAAYRVDQKEIHAFQEHSPNPADLLTTTAWASLEAVLRLSSWLRTPTPSVAR